MPDEKPDPAPDLTQAAQSEVIARVLRNLFNSPEHTLNLATFVYGHEPPFDAAAIAAANALLSACNGGVSPQFSAVQLEALALLLRNVNYARVSPVTAEQRIRLDALWFWRELLSIAPERVSRFHDAVTAFRASPSAAALEQVMVFFREMGLGREWGQAHAEALGGITTEDARFASLQWFSAPGDIW